MDRECDNMRLPPHVKRRVPHVYLSYINGGTLTLSRATFPGRKEKHKMHEPTPASRPMRADAQRNYASLLKTARAAVSERGADIVLEDIARSAGVAIGTLYRHFPTRQDLLEAVFLDETNELRAHAEELASAPVPFN